MDRQTPEPTIEELLERARRLVKHTRENVERLRRARERFWRSRDYVWRVRRRGGPASRLERERVRDVLLSW